MRPNPTMAPTMEWVVDTGSERQVAKLTQRAAESRAERAPRMASRGSAMAPGATIPWRMVSVTWEPMKVAPTTLRVAAITTACRTVIALAPTAEAMELARSFAPMFQAMYSPMA